MSIKILSLDDEVSITEIVNDFLELTGTCELKTLNDSVVAKALLENEKYDLIITDHRMPNLSGIELVKLMRKSDHMNLKTPILVLTATESDVKVELGDLLKEDIKVLNKVDDLHRIGQIVKELFPEF